MIGLLKNGDIITIDAINNILSVDLTAQEIADRRAAWQPPESKAQTGMLRKYRQCVSSASEGCVTDE